MVYYANGVASAKSNELVDKSILEQMINSKDYDSCFSLALSTPIFAGCDENNIDFALQDSKQKLYDFILQNSPSKEITDFFLLAQDFDNFGVICRLASVGKNLDSNLFVKGLSSQTDLVLLYNSASNDIVPRTLEKAFRDMPKGLGLSQIDLYFKQKKYETLKLSMKNNIMKILINDMLDLQNISVLLRSKDKEDFIKNRVVYGNLKEKDLSKLFARDKTVLYNLTGNTKPIASLVFVSSKEKAFEQLDKLANELPLLSLSPFLKNTDSFAPFLEYCFLYLIQLKNIKMILSFKKNNVKCNIQNKLLGVKNG